jgi:hypothetical protein
VWTVEKNVSKERAKKGLLLGVSRPQSTLILRFDFLAIR